MSANEAPLLIAAIVILVLWAAMIWIGLTISRGVRAGDAVDRTVLLRGDSAEVLQDLHGALADAPNSYVERGTPGELHITFTVLPDWAVGIAVILFPLGLVALAARRQVVAVTALSSEGSNSRLHLRGPFSNLAIDRINRVIHLRS